MDSDDDALMRESGERLAISMTVSALLCEITESDDRRLGEMRALLSTIVEAQLAQVPEDVSAGAAATREMFDQPIALSACQRPSSCSTCCEDQN